MDLSKLRLDPAWDLIFNEHPVPILGVHAADELNVCACAEGKEIKIFWSGPIPAAQPVRCHGGLKTLHGRKSCIGR